MIFDAVTNKLFNKLLAGIVAAGDSKRLGGKSASEYVATDGSNPITGLLEFDNGYNFSGVKIKRKQSADNSTYSAQMWTSNAKNALFALRNEDTNEQLTTIQLYPEKGTIIINGIEYTLATTADLANYLPLDGSASMIRNLKVGNESSADAITVSLTNALRQLYLQIQSGGTVRLRDVTNENTILQSTADGTNTFNGTASGNLPSTGGNVTGNVNVSASNYQPITVTNTDTGTNAVYVKFLNANGAVGYIGFHGKNSIGWKNAEQTANYEIHHDGNSAKVAIQETAPTDTTALWVW